MIPKHVNYNQLKPLGYPATVKPTVFSSNNNLIAMHETVDIRINSKGFWDPYSCMIHMIVDFEDDSNEADKIQQIDNSASSFVNELVIDCASVELERIREYDILAAMLNDMAYSPGTKSGRSGIEGMGFNITPNIKVANNQFITKSWSTLKVSETKMNADAVVTNHKVVGFNNSEMFFDIEEYFDQLSKLKTTDAETKIVLYPDQYAPSTRGCREMDGTRKIPSILDQYTDLDIFSTPLLPLLRCLDDEKEIEGSEEATSTSTLIKKYFNRIDKGLLTHNNTFGCENWNNRFPSFNERLDCPQLSNNNWEPMFSTTVSQNCIANGRLAGSTICVGDFTVPLLSGLFGVLMPSDDYKYIPIFAFKDLNLRFNLNPFACHTSGYDDTYKCDNENAFNTLYKVRMGAQLKRLWKFRKFEINVDILLFDYSIEQIIQNQLMNGIVFHTHSWIQGPQYLLSNTNEANQTWHINCAFESLKALFWVFIPKDYDKYSFCRKNYRLSNNLAKYQIRIGIDYYPSIPVEGDAGANAMFSSLNYSQTNLPFVNGLWKSMNKFNDINHECSINSTNFAVNQRFYDVTNTDPLFAASCFNMYDKLPDPTTAIIAWDDGITLGEENKKVDMIEEKSLKLDKDNFVGFRNTETACGFPLYHENRCVGKAIYGIGLESMANDGSVISGVNTKNFTPFEVNMTTTTDPIDPLFDRPRTLYFFCFYDMLLQIKGNSFTVLGR